MLEHVKRNGKIEQIILEKRLTKMFVLAKIV